MVQSLISNRIERTMIREDLGCFDHSTPFSLRLSPHRVLIILTDFDYL